MSNKRITKIVHTELRDGTKVSLVPYNGVNEAPQEVVSTLHDLLNEIIEEGKTYPIELPLSLSEFIEYYFKYFVTVMVSGDIDDPKLVQGDDILGCFYIKPNYPGRSAHVCNGGFLVATKARGKSCGTIMGKQYVKWAPLLGYKSSVFNLVYASNVASCRIWEGLGFQQLGRVPKAGRLRDNDELVDAIIYGYDFERD